MKSDATSSSTHVPVATFNGTAIRWFLLSIHLSSVPIPDEIHCHFHILPVKSLSSSSQFLSQFHMEFIELSSQNGFGGFPLRRPLFDTQSFAASMEFIQMDEMQARLGMGALENYI